MGANNRKTMALADSKGIMGPSKRRTTTLADSREVMGPSKKRTTALDARSRVTEAQATTGKFFSLRSFEMYKMVNNTFQLWWRWRIWRRKLSQLLSVQASLRSSSSSNVVLGTGPLELFRMKHLLTSLLIQDDDLSGAAQHAQQHAGNSGDSNMFSNVVSHLGQNKQNIGNQQINEQGM
jgi:hypothetical protein